MTNIFKKYWVKLFQKNKYLDIKRENRSKKTLDIYNQNIKNEIEKIENRLKNKKTLNFAHAGHMGDLIYSLSVVKELSKSYTCNFFIVINKKVEQNYLDHPSGNVFINDRAAKLLLPLLEKQEFLNTVKIYNNEEIDIDFDLFRKVPINLNFHSTRWFSHLIGVPIKMSEKFLNVGENNIAKNKIVILRSKRYTNPFINYQFLNQKKNLIFIGLKDEFEDLKKDVSNLDFYDCKDFLEMAEIINSAKFFIGNQSLAFAIAEALKVDRLLEASPESPFIFPIGGNGYDFYHQIHFEKYFKILNSKN